MIQEDMLHILVCPEDHSRLHRAGRDLIARLNEAIRGRRLTNRGGQTVEAELSEALVREDNRFAYPVINDIPMLLVDEGIPLDRFEDGKP